MTTRRAGRAERGARRTLLGLLALAAAGGCDLYTSVDPDAVGSIAVDTLPFPAVVAGDTLRNEAGAVAPLRARVYDQSGGLLPQAEVRWTALDSGVTVDAASGIVRGAHLTGATGARIIAESGGLQSQPVALFVTRQPTAITTTIGDTVVRYRVGADVETNQLALPARVVARVGAADSAVRGWIVRYTLVGAAPSFADSVRLVAAAGTGRPGAAITDATGAATRSLRVFVPTARLPDPATDTATVVVEMSASWRGQPLPGSPRRVRVLLRPRT